MLHVPVSSSVREPARFFSLVSSMRATGFANQQADHVKTTDQEFRIRTCHARISTFLFMPRDKHTGTDTVNSSYAV